MTQSISNYIRDAIYDRVTKVGTWKTTRKSPAPTMQTGDVPALGVYLIRETKNPDGDSNVGPPRFIVDAVITVMVIDLANKPDVLEGSVDAKIDAIETALLTDPTFIDLRDANNHPIIDSIMQVQRTYQFPNNGESYYIECRLQFTIRYFCFFEPVAPNALTEVDVHIEPFDNETVTGTYTAAIPLAQS